MFLKWTNQRRSHRRRVSNYLLLMIALTSLSSPTINSQEQHQNHNSSDISTSTTTTTSSSTPASTTTTTTTEDNNSTAAEVLLAKDEFVDYTEAPTLLFDGLSNEPKNDTSETKPNKPEADQTTTTTTTTTTTARPATSDLGATEGTPSTVNRSETTTTGASNESDIPEENDNDNDDQTDDGDHSKEPTDGQQKQHFEPPQNVSQYMDYIETLFHDLRHQITDLFEPHIPQLIRTSQMVQLTSGCSYDMLRMALALRQFEPWALKMIDSSGKVPEGIFEGSFTALGSYDECIGTVFDQSAAGQSSSSSSSSASAGDQFSSSQPSTSGSNSEKQQQQQQATQVAATQGKYCLVNVSPFLPPKPPADKVERMFQDEANRRNLTKDDQFSRLSPMFYYMKFRIGVCIPSTCDQTDMDSISSALSSSLRLNITIPDCRVKQLAPMTSQQLVGGAIFGLLLALVFGATLADWSRRKWDQIERHELKVISGQLTRVEGADDTDHHDQDNPGPIRNGQFRDRLSKSWTWMSFSLLANFRLYFDQNRKTRRDSQQVVKCQVEQEQQQSRKMAMEDHQESNGRVLVKCLNGIRVLSLCWVIVANSYITLDPRATKRLVKTREAPRDFLFQLVVQASLAIETFFFLSGILMSLSFSRRLAAAAATAAEEMQDDDDNPRQSKAKNRKAGQANNNLLKWLHFYVHRYVRMTPATMLVIAFSMYAYRYGDGPLWLEATQKAHQSCSVNWWRHLLHVANFIDTRQMCFIHYWYIAADMQLFLFAPLVLFLVYRWRRLGLALMAAIGAASIGFVFYTTYARNLPPTLLFYNSDPESRREFGNTIMTKPLTHALPYMVGMLVGCWLNNQLYRPTTTTTTTSSSTKTNSPDLEKASSSPQQPPSSAASSSSRLFELSNSFNSYGRLSWTTLFGSAATAVALVELFLPYKWNNSHLPTRLMASLYAALFRFGWALVLAYLVVSCRHRRGRRCEPPIQLQLEESCCCCLSGVRRASHHPLTRSNGKCHQPPTQLQQTNISTTTNRQRTAAKQAANRCDYCLCGSGGNLVNRLLSLDVFTHLSKLSFVAYLIHLPLMSVFISQTRGLFAFSHTLVIHLALSYLVMTTNKSQPRQHQTIVMSAGPHDQNRRHQHEENTHHNSKRSGKYYVGGEFHQPTSHQRPLNLASDIYKQQTNLSQFSGGRSLTSQQQPQQLEQQQQIFMAYPVKVNDEQSDVGDHHHHHHHP